MFPKFILNKDGQKMLRKGLGQLEVMENYFLKRVILKGNHRQLEEEEVILHHFQLSQSLPQHFLSILVQYEFGEHYVLLK
ncbi:unnamed protein product [Meloidogyne enterolobii]|uniref:Uncharacterized protein n=1 Tax=Meloidogyne enterolobii TaxID=390850 RepID=A0ACB0YH36_MELEN